VIGLVALDARTDEYAPARNFGYVFNPEYHGQGYATEACRAAIAHVFEGMGESRFVTGTHVANLPSRRLLARLGFCAIGEGLYALERDEWLARERTQDA